MTTNATFIGVRHHSPACARLVERTIRALRPAHVLIEGPADMNDRIDELLLGHDLPIAVFTSYRDDERAHASWTPLCDYSPEWVALTVGRAVGAQVRFIDLPAWHPAFAGRRNRFADAEQRYQDATERLSATFAVDNVDTLWDHLFEADPDGDLAARLDAYFELVRGDSATTEEDAQRETAMTTWIRAALADAGDRPVVVVTGGFHRPALIRLVAETDVDGASGWPEPPALPPDAIGGSYLVPFSFKRLDSFDGYQSGMPSPGYYQDVWEHGLDGAAPRLVGAVVDRLRRRKQPVSTADLIAADTLSRGLARLRGHESPTRTDVLDGLASALVTEGLDVRLPWTTRGHLRPGTDPVVVEMVAALSGNRVGTLHADTPLPPLVHDAQATMERLDLDGRGDASLDLTTDTDRERSRALHRLRVLRVPGFERSSGPTTGIDPVATEHWVLDPSADRLPALIEAGAYGHTLLEAVTAAISERVEGAGHDVDPLAMALFDLGLCGVEHLADEVIERIDHAIGTVRDLAPLGRMLHVVLSVWRHDTLLGAGRSPALGAVIGASVTRALWLIEGVRGGPQPAEPGRLVAVVALRDAVRHAFEVLTVPAEAPVEVMARIASDPEVPPDLRGAAVGFTRSFDASTDLVRAVRGAARGDVLGDWLAGLFALAREEVLTSPSTDDADSDADGHADRAGADVLGAIDEVIAALDEHTFLVALPALRQAFTYFPPREREQLARLLLDRRGRSGSTRSLLRSTVDPMVVAAARELEARVDQMLDGEGLAPVGAG